METLDLETLKELKFISQFYSDMSVHSNLYHYICKKIKEIEAAENYESQMTNDDETNQPSAS